MLEVKKNFFDIVTETNIMPNAIIGESYHLESNINMIIVVFFVSIGKWPLH